MLSRLRDCPRNIAFGGFHDSGERFDAPKCRPNTLWIRRRAAEKCKKNVLLVDLNYVTRNASVTSGISTCNVHPHDSIIHRICSSNRPCDIQQVFGCSNRNIIRPLENACDCQSKHQTVRVLTNVMVLRFNPPLFMYVLLNALRRISVPLMLLIVSRPEPQIRNTFNILAKSRASRHIVLDKPYKLSRRRYQGVSP